MLALKKYLAIFTAIAVFFSLLAVFQGRLFATSETSTPSSSNAQYSFTCRPKPNAEVLPPSRSPKVKLAVYKQSPKVCTDGTVPQPTGQLAPQGLIKPPMPASLLQPQKASGYLYAATYERSTGIGAQGDFTQDSPHLAPQDAHSLAELSGQSADGKQTVEIGWTVDRVLNGDSNPHLFVSSWVNGQPNCYNGCGYVQYSNTIYPGMTVNVTNTPKTYAIQNFDGDWWLWYGDQWIGYFPDSVWSSHGVTFHKLKLTQWFGEVNADGGSHTQMGNGRRGDDSRAASVSNMEWITNSGSVDASALPNPINSDCYSVGNLTGNSFNYGGPGC